MTASSEGMDEARLAAGLPELVERAWCSAPVTLSPFSGPVGMGSVTTGLEAHGLGRLVAKWVPDAAAGALDRGSAVAAELQQVGLSVGPAVPTSAGQLSAPFAGGRVALLRRVDGRPLTGATAADQERMARLLAQVHAVRRPRLSTHAYLDDSLAQARAVEAWVVPSVSAVRAEYRRLPALSWGLVHHDPAPEAFFHDPAAGVTSLIDWTGAGEGPLLFDVASAVMYLGGPEGSRVFVDTYLRLAPDVVRAEAGEHLAFLVRFRGAVQAAYFSNRVADVDLTGISGQAENVTGLHDARRMLAGSGLAEAAYPKASMPVLRTMRPADLPAVGRVQEEGSVLALAHVFPQSTSAFPRDAVQARWQLELADASVDCFVIAGADGEVAGFAATRADELLHLGTAVPTWGTGLARVAHDELVTHVREQGHARARLWVFEENHHARHFYEHRGWRPTGARRTSTFAPHPVLLAYELVLVE